MYTLSSLRNKTLEIQLKSLRLSGLKGPNHYTEISYKGILYNTGNIPNIL